MATRPKTDVLPDGPRKLAAASARLVHDGIHVRTGLPVVDATEPRYVEVTEDDARLGVQNDPRLCGFSQSCRRTIDGLADVEFYISKAYLIFGDHVDRYSVMGSTQRALAAFDLTGKFLPGRYWLSRPTPLGARKARAKAKAKPAKPGPPLGGPESGPRIGTIIRSIPD